MRDRVLKPFLYLWERYSDRQKRVRGEQPAAQSTSALSLPSAFRAKVQMIIMDTVGTPGGDGRVVEAWYLDTMRIWSRRTGQYLMVEVNSFHDGPATQLMEYIGTEPDAEKCLDVIELCVIRLKDRVDRGRVSYSFYDNKLSVEEAIDTLNKCFLEYGIRCQFENGQIIRIDSQVAHAEIVHPAIVLLAERRYTNANDEYMKAHEHYRRGDYSACVVECRKSFESVMKIICEKRSWRWKDPPVANSLINACLDNHLVPRYYENHLEGLKKVFGGATLASNKPGGGHGQGGTPAPVPQHVASYTLHVTAANILFFINSEKALP